MPGEQPPSHPTGGVAGGAGGTGAGDEHGARSAEAVELFDRLAHDALVVTAVAEPDDEEPDEFKPEDEREGVELDVTDVVEVDACVFWLASAGSCPDTSWRTIPPVVVMKTAVAAPTTRRRMRRMRWRRLGRGMEGMAPASTPCLGSA
jgi:hypothetical protein